MVPLRLATRYLDFMASGRLRPSSVLVLCEEAQVRLRTGAAAGENGGVAAALRSVAPGRGIGLVTVNQQAQFHHLTPGNEFPVELDLDLWVSRVGKSSLQLSHRLHTDGRCVAEVDIIKVAVPEAGGRSLELPAAFHDLEDILASGVPSLQTEGDEKGAGATVHVETSPKSTGLEVVVGYNDENTSGHADHSRVVQILENEYMRAAQPEGSSSLPPSWEGLEMSMEDMLHAGDVVGVESQTNGQHWHFEMRKEGSDRHICAGRVRLGA